MVMGVFALMLLVTACYTCTSLSDKYAVAEAKYSGDEFTFMMCSSMSIFLLITLPFQNLYCELSINSLFAVLLVAVCKLLEFQMSALVLKELSAFELKAWLGVTLFISYFTDVLYGASVSVFKIISIIITVIGLVFIAKSGHENKIQYKLIALPLVLYLGSKYGYGLVIKAFKPYISSTMQLLLALVLIAVIMLFRIKPIETLKKNKKGAKVVILARIPNTVGMLAENAIIAISLANYSFVQPMILVTLFLIGVIRREKHTKLNLIGSLICVVGVVLFNLFRV